MFRVLALDGGGIRGAAGAAFLEAMEQRLGPQFLDCFDLICGTSTGSIIAASVAIGCTGRQIRSFYEEDGKRVFHARPPASGLIAWLTRLLAGRLGYGRFNTDRIYQSGYLSDELETVLLERLGTVTLQDVQRRLLITSLDLNKNETLVFESRTHDKSPSTFGAMRLVDAVLASTAAPTFFEPRELQVHTTSGPRDLWLTDGGLWANNPALAGLIEALKVQSHALGAMPQPQEERELLPETCILSIGTGLPKDASLGVPTITDVSRYGYLWWGKPLLPLVFDSQSTGTNYFMRQLRDACRLRYLRIDFELRDELRPVDAVDRIAELLAIGAQQAAADGAAVKDLLGLA